MGQSTNAQLAWGVVLEDGAELPWEGGDGDFDDWWRTEMGWDDSGSPFGDTPTGYKDGYGKDDPRIGQYFDARQEWDKAHPAPVQIGQLLLR